MPTTALTQSRPARRWSVVATITIALIASVLTPISASAAPVALSGVVVGPTGSAVPSLTVRALSLPSGEVVATTRTSSSGIFAFSALAPGDYTLGFPATSTTFAQTLGGAPTLPESRLISLEDGGGNAAYVRAALAPSGSITGTVKNTSGTALRSIAVKAYTETDGEWVLAAQATTSTSGTYTIRGLAPGAFRLEVTGGATSSYATTYSGNAASIFNASDVGVVAQVTTRANFTLGKAGVVSGTVRGSFGVASTELLSGTRVVPFRYVGQVGSYEGTEELRHLSSTTSSSGTYTLKGLPPGEYTLRFEPRTSAPFSPSGTVYGSAFLGGTDQPDFSRSFVVTSGGTVTNRNIVLAAAGSIAGTVRDGGGIPLASVRVTLGGTSDDPFNNIHAPRSTLTNAQGEYVFTGLPAGTHLIYVGSFTDSNLSDGITENTGWERLVKRTVLLSVGENAAGIDVVATPRTPLIPVGAGSVPELTNLQGDWIVGGSIEVTAGAWPTTGGDTRTTYSWYRSGARISGADSFRYTFQPGDEGHTITAVVERYDSRLGYGRVETGETTVIGAGAPPTVFADNPSIEGTPAVGSTLTINPRQWHVAGLDESGWVDPGIVWSYVWQRSSDLGTWTTIPGATGSTYRVTETDRTEGPYLQVLLSGTRDGYNPIENYPSTPIGVGEGTFVQRTAPKITTTTSTYRVSTGSWTPTPSSYTYLWRVHDQTGAVVKTFATTSIPRAGLTGKYVSVTVTPVAPGLTSLGATLTAQRGSALVSAGSLATTGSPVVGGTLNAPALTFTPNATTTTYAWQYKSGTTWRALSGATTSSFVVPANLLNRSLRVVMTASRPGYASVTKTSTSTALVGIGAALVATDVTTSGVPAAASTVQVDSSTWSPAATSVSFQWRSGPTATGPWTAISGATSAAYTVPASLDGQFISVVLTGKRSGHPNGIDERVLGQVFGGTLVNLTPPTVIEVDGSPGTYTVIFNGSWSPAASGGQYAWYSYGTNGEREAFALSTSQTFDTTASALYRPVDVRVAGTRDGFSSGFVFAPVKDGTLVVNNAPSINGPYNSPLNLYIEGISHTLSNPPDEYETTHQWQVKPPSGSWTDIPGETDLIFTPVNPSLVGSEVRLEVTSTAVRYAPIVTTTDPVLIDPGAQIEPGVGGNAPSFSGPARIGQTVSINPGTWSVPGSTFTYQWEESNGFGGFDPIPGATSAVYSIPISKHGVSLRVFITASKAGHPSGTYAYFMPAPIGDGVITSVTSPTVSKSGSVLTVTPGTWSVSGTTPEYEWERISRDGGLAVTVGFGASYTLTEADIDQYIRVTVGAAKPLYTSGLRSLVAQAGRALAPTTQAVVSGDRVVGAELGVIPPDWNTSSATTTIQWLRNGVAIPGATQSTYTQSALDVGKTVSVRLTGSDLGYVSGSVTISGGLTYSTVVATNVKPPTISPSASDPRVGDLLTATAGSWSLSSMTYAYQWYRGDDPIPGARSSTYRLAAADRDEQVHVRVTAQRTGIAPVTALSRVVSVREGLAAVLTSPSSFATTGITRSSSTGLISSASLTWNRPVSVIYRWESRPDDVSSWQPIVGAEFRSHTPAAASGTRIRLTVIAVRPGHTTTVISSNVIVLP